MITNVNQKKGIAMLMAVLTLSVILGVSLTILGAVIKEFNITSTTRNSVIAVYAADTGIECALLWDIRGFEPAFYGDLVIPSTTNFPHPSSGSGIDCFGEDISSTWTVFRNVPNVVRTQFDLNFPGGGGCAEVEITKTKVGEVEQTSILSKGYNVDCSSYYSDITAVERAIKVDYIFN